PTAKVDAALRAEVAAVSGLAAMYLGHDAEAEAALMAARDEAERAGEPLVVARAMNSLGMLHQRASAFHEARVAYEACIEIAHDQGHLPFEASFRQNLASLLHQQHVLGEALDTYRSALDLARRFGGASELGQIEHNLARLLCQLGQLDEAEGRGRRAVSFAEFAGRSGLQGDGEIVLAEIALAQGDGDACATWLDRAQEHVDSGDVVATIDVSLVRARLALERGDGGRARDLLASVDATPAVDLQGLHRELLLAQADLADPAGSPADAAARLHEVLGRADAQRHSELLFELHDALAEASARLDDDAAAREHRAKARDLCEAAVAALPPELRDPYRAMSPQVRILAA
ncbi:MAG: tetratricopeptide repeat protein, partial [Deltaproteobacteria bacterium]|nr:tetratricopeptide repeat protein [Deltaproteobacteria bacterium]